MTPLSHPKLTDLRERMALEIGELWDTKAHCNETLTERQQRIADRALSLIAEELAGEEAPADPAKAFAHYLRTGAEIYGAACKKHGSTDAQARFAIVLYLLDCSADHACRAARSEGREPDKTKWAHVTAGAFDRAAALTPAPAQDKENGT